MWNGFGKNSLSERHSPKYSKSLRKANIAIAVSMALTIIRSESIVLVEREGSGSSETKTSVQRKQSTQPL